MLTASITEITLAKRLREAVSGGVASSDIAFALQADIAPEDVRALRATTRAFGLCVILRCPKRGAVGFHGIFGAKRMVDGKDRHGASVKSGENGIGVHPDTGRIFVSDYDMMSLWEKRGGGYAKIFCSSTIPGRDRGHWTPAALQAVKRLNAGLTSPLQHGAQDDFTPAPGKSHPNVSPDGRFAAIREGEARYIEGMHACKTFYDEHGLYWPYDAQGHFTKAAEPG